jgi:hypothetical protein
MKELSEMTDRELDRTVALEVMRWHRGGIYYCDEMGNTLDVEIVDWKPSENIAQAWRVVDRFLERDSGCLFSVGAPHEIFSSPRCQFWEAMIYRSSGYADSPAKAICLASLAAVRAGKGEVGSR